MRPGAETGRLMAGRPRLAVAAGLLLLLANPAWTKKTKQPELEAVEDKTITPSTDRRTDLLIYNRVPKVPWKLAGVLGSGARRA